MEKLRGELGAWAPHDQLDRAVENRAAHERQYPGDHQRSLLRAPEIEQRGGEQYGHRDRRSEQGDAHEDAVAQRAAVRMKPARHGLVVTHEHVLLEYRVEDRGEQPSREETDSESHHCVNLSL